jgi:uncharacterized protein YndB with AHSA1/START domain
MRTVTTYIRRPPDACWSALIDASVLTGWVPGLRRARVVATDDTGLPREIQFEFSTSLVYSLVYTYDGAAREVRWEPRLGKRDGVRGFARVDPFDEGSRITYALEPGDGRSPADRALGDLDALVAAFARWMER